VLRHPNEIQELEVKEDNLYIQAFNLFMTHLFDDPITKNYVYAILACHGRNLRTLPIVLNIVGGGGTGKSEFGNIVEALFGRNTTTRPSIKQMGDSDFLHSTLHDIAVLIISEGGIGLDPKLYSKAKEQIKAVTGEKSISAQKKFQDMEQIDVFALVIILANESWYLDDIDDRRKVDAIPKYSLQESPDILAFEKDHLGGTWITQFILKGVEKGIIAKYLSRFYKAELGKPPITEDKREMAQQQGDPIRLVQSLLKVTKDDKKAKSNAVELVRLMMEYEVPLFKRVMEDNYTGYSHIKLSPNNFLWRGQIRELIGLMSDGFIDVKVINKAFIEDKNKTGLGGQGAMPKEKKLERVKFCPRFLIYEYNEYKRLNKEQQGFEESGFEEQPESPVEIKL